MALRLAWIAKLRARVGNTRCPGLGAHLFDFTEQVASCRGEDGPDDRCGRASSEKRLSCVERRGFLGLSGRASGRRAPIGEVAWVVEKFRTPYFDSKASTSRWGERGRFKLRAAG